MVWLAVNKDGTEAVYRFKPKRDNIFCQWGPSERYPYDQFVELPKGSIKKLIGRELKWSDDPVEI